VEIPFPKIKEGENSFARDNHDDSLFAFE
jgi:hypothetical protein